MSKDEKLFDVRVSDRYISEGQLDKKEFESYIKKLPDSEEKSETLIIEEEEQVEEIEEDTAEIEEENGSE